MSSKFKTQEGKKLPILVDASCCVGKTFESYKNALDAMRICQIEVRGGTYDDTI